MTTRLENWNYSENTDFDVVIIGGGINGSCLFDTLSRKGYKILLLDKSDFASGTSQASGMMVWGGLLYLKNLDFVTVYRLCKSRDRMIENLNHAVSPKVYRYIPSINADINPNLVHAGLYLYWLMGLFRRIAPRCEKSYQETSLLKPGIHRGALLYEEGVLHASDSRFTLEWLLPHMSEEHVALNYCTAGGLYSPKDRLWHLNLQDQLHGKETTVRSKVVVNCAGIWTDEVNRQFEIDSPFKHALSKGVYIGIKRPNNHDSLMIFEMGNNSDVLTFVPWGPVSLWGPTETIPQNIEDGLSVHPEDVQFLLERINYNLAIPVDKTHIVSVRCGIRPLAVKKDYHQNCYPLNLSRQQKIITDGKKPWISSYGGKLTGCEEMALKISNRIEKYCQPLYSHARQALPVSLSDMEFTSWPNLNDKVPSPRWCMEHEMCCSLDDYLRRRTNLSQWIARQGLGNTDEYIPQLVQAALAIYDCDEKTAMQKVQDYCRHVEENFDQLIERV